MSQQVELRCVNDDGGAAIGTCLHCGAPVCEACVARHERDTPVCRPCAYREAALGVGQATAEKEAGAQRLGEAAAKGPGRMRRILGLAALAGICSTLAGWAVPATVASFTAPRPYAIGAVGDKDAQGLDDCISDLWRIRAALDIYRNREQKAPDQLSELADVPAACSGCGGTWGYQRLEELGFRVVCPTPEKHGRTGISIDHRVGPPRVALDRRAG